MQDEIYLDNNATTKVAPEVLEAMMLFFSEHYGNAGSMHRKGLLAERAIFESRNLVLKTLGVNAHKVVFTSGGTESDNLAIFGAAPILKSIGNHIITTSVEHPAVLECMSALSKDSFEISYVSPRNDGVVHPEDIIHLIKDNTVLVSVMHINNETGAIFPIAEIAQAVKTKNPKCLVHSDGVQAVGKIKPDLSQIDLYALSGHKFHGSKGVGALIVREGVRLDPIIRGGGQEGGIRSGTENVAGIVGFAKALEFSCADLDKKISHFETIREKLINGLDTLKEVSINSPVLSTPQTVNVSFIGVPSEVLVSALSEHQIYVGTGSACGQKKKRNAPVLSSLGFPNNIVDSSIRFSFSGYTTLPEINKTVKVLNDIVPKLREAQ